MYVFGMVGIIIFTICSVLFFDWHSRMVMLARVYAHGKTSRRGRRHYKKHWTLLQRLFWIPLFKEPYSGAYRMIAYFSYGHVILALSTIIGFLLNEFVFLDVDFWHYIFIAMTVFFMLRFIYVNAIARGKIK